MIDIKYINMFSNIFTAFGTVGAVITALWLGYRDSKPTLKVNAMIGVTAPDMIDQLCVSCVNVSKQPIICTSFAFKPYRFRKKESRLMLIYCIEVQNLSTPLPKLLQYSDKAEKCFDSKFFDKESFQKILCKYKWLAKIQLKWCWRVIAKTNIKEFEGKLSNSLIEKIISINFSKNSK